MNMDLFLTVPDYDADRDPLDRNYTPAWVTEVLVECMGPRIKGPILEPCAGERHISRVLEGHGHQVTSFDICPVVDDVHCVDFLRFQPYPQQRWDWVITNPPYRYERVITLPTYRHEVFTAAHFAKKALNVAEVGVAILVWLSFLEGCEDRLELLREHPPTDIIHLPRFNFLTPGKVHKSQPERPAVWLVWDGWIQDGRTRHHWFGPEARP